MGLEDTADFISGARLYIKEANLPVEVVYMQKTDMSRI